MPPIHGHTNVGWLPKTYIFQLCVDTGCHSVESPRMMADTDGKRKSRESMLLACFDDDDDDIEHYF